MDTPARRRRKWLVAVTVVLAAAVLGVLLWPREVERPEAPEATPVVQAPAPAGDSGRAPSPAAKPVEPLASGEEPRPAAEPPPPGTTPAQPLAPPPETLPATTQVLAEEFFPGTTDWEDVPVDESHQYRLRILPKRYNVVAPLPLAVLLEIVDRQGQRQPLRNPRVRVRALDDESRPWVEVPVKDDGTGEDEQGGDLRYTATLQPDREQKKALLGRVLVEGSVEVPGVGVRVIPAVLIYTQGPRAKLTGRWSDYARRGHLYLEAEVEAEEAGLFTLMAQVFGPNLEPIAWVKQTEKLGKGRGRITLEVFGKALHDAGVDGPYRVRQVLLSRDYENSSDYDPGVTVEEAYRTRTYRAGEFSSEAYVPPPRNLAEEVTAEHPSQRDKPPPERSRQQVPATEPQPQPEPGSGPPQPAQDLGH